MPWINLQIAAAASWTFTSSACRKPHMVACWPEMDQTSNKKCKNKGTNKKSNIYKVLAPSQVVQDFFHQQYYPLPPQWLSLSPFLGGNRALVRYVHEKHVRVGQHTDRNESYAWWTKILHDLGWFKRCWIDGTCALSTGAWMVNSSKLELNTMIS